MKMPNNGRQITAKDLFRELKKVADDSSYDWNISTPSVLGKELNSLEDALSIYFHIGHGHTMDGNWWSFERTEAINFQ